MEESKPKKDLETLVQGGIAINTILFDSGFIYAALKFDEMTQETNPSPYLGAFIKFGGIGIASIYTYLQAKELHQIKTKGKIDRGNSLYINGWFTALTGLTCALNISEGHTNGAIMSGLFSAGFAIGTLVDKLKSIYHNKYSKKSMVGTEIEMLDPYPEWMAGPIKQ